MSGRGTWAAVPVKDFAMAKTRLAGVLEAGERRELARAMLGDVLRAVSATPRMAGILVVTGDPEAMELAAALGARVLFEACGRGMSEACMAAARLLGGEGCSQMIAIPGDVPLVTPGEIARVLDAHRRPPAVTLVPSRDGRGTNAVLCSPPGAIPLSFGGGSFSTHMEAARRCSIEPDIVRLPGLGLDVDWPADLVALEERPSSTLTARYLETIDVGQRLGADMRPRSRA